jgi:hypothetical protein
MPGATDHLDDLTAARGSTADHVNGDPVTGTGRAPSGAGLGSHAEIKSIPCRHRIGRRPAARSVVRTPPAQRSLAGLIPRPHAPAGVALSR